jgi:serine protease
VAGTPSITGTPKVGVELHAQPGTWTPGPVDFTYQWLRDGTLISGATGETYVPAGLDAGKTLWVLVTGSHGNSFNHVSAASAPTAPVAAGTLTAPAPTVSGTRKVGYALTAAAGTWTSGTTLKYQWYRSGAAIVGATSSKYTLGAADLGKTMKLRVTGSKPGYTTAAKDSVSTAAVMAGNLVAPTPRISGVPRQGYTLTANTGTWTYGAALRYQWYRSGVAIAGATARTYGLVAADRYDTLKVRVVGSKTGYTTVTKYSGPTLRIP